MNCVESVERFNTAPIKYILVDNGSTKPGVVDELDREMRRRFGSDYCRLKEGESHENNLPRFTFLVSPDNTGYADGNNKGLRLAYTDDEIDTVMILNSDILFVEDIIPALKQIQSSISDCGIISPILYKKNLDGLDLNCARLAPTLRQIIGGNFASPFKWVFKCLDRKKNNRYILVGKEVESLPDKPIKIEMPSGSCMLMTKDFMAQIDGFDSNTFLYYEENILESKIKQAGKNSYLAPKLKCIHLGATTTKKSPSAFVAKCSLNSQRYYVTNYLKPSLAMRWSYNISCWWTEWMLNLKTGVHRLCGRHK